MAEIFLDFTCEGSFGGFVAVLSCNPEFIRGQFIADIHQIARWAAYHNVYIGVCWALDKKVDDSIDGGLVSIHFPVAADKEFTTHFEISLSY